MTAHSPIRGQARSLARAGQLCSAAGSPGITIGGETYVPDAATAYVEFHLSHAFPVYLDNCLAGDVPDKTCIHPQTVANSYQSLKGKVLNLAHLMRSYDPQLTPRDRILGTVMAVEFPPTPAGGWQVQSDPALAPGIRAVAALHKNAEGVQAVIDTWAAGKTPFSDTQWTVSMENESYVSEGGFLVKCGAGDLGELTARTPADFQALGWTYVPYAEASDPLRACLKAGGGMGLAADWGGFETRYLNGGLNGRIFYYGVALTPRGKESAARVSRIEASAGWTAEEAARAACGAILEALKTLTQNN